MYTQLKWQSVLSFVLALLGAIIASRLLLINWLEWQISIEDKGSGYKIVMLTNKINTSNMLEDINFPSHIAKIYSSNGECWWGEIKLEASPDDRLKEKWLLRMFNLGIIASCILVFLSCVNLVRQWWKKYLTKILFLMGTSVAFFVLSRFLGPKVSIDPDFSKMDFDCRFDLILNANLISINPQAIVLVAVSILLGLIALVLLIRTWSHSAS